MVYFAKKTSNPQLETQPRQHTNKQCVSFSSGKPSIPIRPCSHSFLHSHSSSSPLRSPPKILQPRPASLPPPPFSGYPSSPPFHKSCTTSPPPAQPCQCPNAQHSSDLPCSASPQQEQRPATTGTTPTPTKTRSSDRCCVLAAHSNSPALGWPAGRLK